MTIETIITWLSKKNYDFSFIGDKSIEVLGFASLENYQRGSITWIKKPESLEKIGREDEISIAVVQQSVETDVPNQIITPKSKEVFFAILHQFWGADVKEGHVGVGTIISEDAIVDPTAYIGYNCSIIGSVQIGAHTVIENNVVIQGKVIIGCNCRIQSQSVIGIDGFGYSKNPESGQKKMIEHFGGVVIGNDVFIASHVNIARGTLDNTVIEDGVKIAPSTHIGHNNRIARNTTVICSQLYGSVNIGEDSYITASTIQNQISIGKHTVVGMGSIVTKPLPDDVVAFGAPAKVVKSNKTDL